MAQLIEKPFFFDNEGSKLFGILHTPCAEVCNRGIKESRGIVFCSPFAEEQTVANRVVTDFARVLCQKGYYVLRFDYRGCGDSEDEFEQATLTTRLSDISAAIDILYQNMGQGHLTLLGLRLGATLAALVGAKDTRVKSLILWEPIVQVGAYFDQFLRMQVMSDNIHKGRIVGTRQKLRNDLQEGKCVDILGYRLSPRCFEEFVNLDLTNQARRFNGPTLIVAISKRQRDRKDLQSLIQAHQESGTPLEFFHVQDQPFWIDLFNPWRELETWYDHDILFQQTTDWLDAVTGRII